MNYKKARRGELAIRGPEATPIGPFVAEFLKEWIPLSRDGSPHTVRSYKDMFKALNRYMLEVHGLRAVQVTFESLDRAVLVGFVAWMVEDRRMKPSSANTRIAALKSFANFVSEKDPSQSLFCAHVDGLEMRKAKEELIRFMTPEAVRAVFDAAAAESFRDLVMLEVLYASGAREAEFIALTPRALRFLGDGTTSIELHGKGRKARVVKVGKNVTGALKAYMRKREGSLDDPLFFSRRGGFMSASGLGYTVRKYAAIARAANPGLLPDDVSPHTFRHSIATHMLAAGKSLEEVRLFLGHESLRTTRVYAKCDPAVVAAAVAAVDEKYINKVAKKEQPEKDELDAWLEKEYGSLL